MTRRSRFQIPLLVYDSPGNNTQSTKNCAKVDYPTIVRRRLLQGQEDGVQARPARQDRLGLGKVVHSIPRESQIIVIRRCQRVELNTSILAYSLLDERCGKQGRVEDSNNNVTPYY